MKRLAISEQLKNGIERIVLLRVRVSHRRRARAKRKARIAALAAVRHTLQGAARLNAGNAKTVFNVGMYILLLDQDIAYFTDDLVCAIGDRRRAFLAKHEAVLLYEAAEDLPQLLGREFRDLVKTLGASAEQLARINSVSLELNQFWQGHREFLGTIRNALAAHRDHDALRYADTLETLRPFEVMARAAELSQLLERLVGVVTELASLTAGPAAIIRDMAASRKKGQAG
jgi:hypothetical protein